MAELDMEFEGEMDALISLFNASCDLMEHGKVGFVDGEIQDPGACPLCKGTVVGISSCDGFQFECEGCNTRFEYDQGLYTEVPA